MPETPLLKLQIKVTRQLNDAIHYASNALHFLLEGSMRDTTNNLDDAERKFKDARDTLTEIQNTGSGGD